MGVSSNKHAFHVIRVWFESDAEKKRIETGRFGPPGGRLARMEAMPLSASVIPFDEIVPGSTVRVATIDGVQYLSIRDVIMCVCNKDGNHAGAVWRNLSEDKKKEVHGFLVNHQFPGPGQSEQPVITFVGALKLIMFLAGDAAKKHRSNMANILRRYYAGDASLVEELAENSRSDAPDRKSVV